MRRRSFSTISRGYENTDHLCTGLDFDKFDLKADHILLLDKRSGKVIGTYRILSSDLVKHFYSEQEFQFEEFLQLPGLKLELGRACIHPDYRKSVAIHLVWKGLGRYAKLTNADYMFGCSSVKSQSKILLLDTLEQLGDSYSSQKFNVRPRFKYRFFLEKNKLNLVENCKDLIPPLLSSYLKAGAIALGEPAYDRDFKCFDVFTCLNLKKLPLKYIKRYMEIEI